MKWRFGKGCQFHYGLNRFFGCDIVLVVSLTRFVSTGTILLLVIRIRNFKFNVFIQYFYYGFPRCLSLVALVVHHLHQNTVIMPSPCKINKRCILHSTPVGIIKTQGNLVRILCGFVPFIRNHTQYTVVALEDSAFWHNVDAEEVVHVDTFCSILVDLVDLVLCENAVVFSLVARNCMLQSVEVQRVSVVEAEHHGCAYCGCDVSALAAVLQVPGRQMSLICVKSSLPAVVRTAGMVGKATGPGVAPCFCLRIYRMCSWNQTSKTALLRLQLPLQILANLLSFLRKPSFLRRLL